MMNPLSELRDRLLTLSSALSTCLFYFCTQKRASATGVGFHTHRECGLGLSWKCRSRKGYLQPGSDCRSQWEDRNVGGGGGDGVLLGHMT